MIDLDSKITLDASYLVSLNEDTWIWQKKLVDASMDLIGKLSRKDLVVGLSKLNYIKYQMCSNAKRASKWSHLSNIKRLFFTSRPID